jgi:PAS domain S-box-containing protein
VLETVLESMPVGVLTTDLTGRITLWNRAAEEMTGLLREEVLGQTPAILREKLCLEPQDLDDDPAAPSEGERSRCRIRTRDGRDRQVLRTVHPLEDEGGGRTGWIQTLTDVTALVELREQVEDLRGIFRRRDRFQGLIGRSEPMQEVYERIRLAADSNVSLHVRGESGTGKELVAAAVHFTGPRAGNPFVRVNCSALPETLLESELFGHARGAFTGAVASKVGRFGRADGGTLFIDEIGDMSPVVQLKLLRVLETKEFERLGDSRSTRVDVRIVTATHRDLRTLVSRGRFREDLYYRVNVFGIDLPPLRERREDIPLLAEHFRERFAKETGKGIREIAPDALRALMTHRWPGNVRELENAIEHAFVTARGRAIRVSDLPGEVRESRRSGPPPSDPLDPRKEILRALEQEDGHRERAAARLGVSRVTLWKRMKKLGVLWPPDPG